MGLKAHPVHPPMTLSWVEIQTPWKPGLGFKATLMNRTNCPKINRMKFDKDNDKVLHLTWNNCVHKHRQENDCLVCRTTGKDLGAIVDC